MQRNNNEDESNVPSQNNLDEIQNNIFENQNSSNEVIDVDMDSPIKDTSKSTAMIKTRLRVKESPGRSEKLCERKYNRVALTANQE